MLNQKYLLIDILVIIYYLNKNAICLNNKRNDILGYVYRCFNFNFEYDIMYKQSYFGIL